MTPTAWGQGAKNALICGIGVLSVWFVTAFAIQQIFGQSRSNSFGIAFVALWCLVYVWWLGAWLYGRAVRGKVLLDCGPHPTRWLFFVEGLFFVVLGVFPATGMFSFLSISETFEIGGLIFCFSFAFYWFVMATGRLQIRENGIWAYWSLVRWDRIGRYRWSPDGTLILRSKGFFSFMQGALPVPREHENDVDDLLAEHRATQAVV
jgi:hypothetical protein